MANRIVTRRAMGVLAMLRPKTKDLRFRICSLGYALLGELNLAWWRSFVRNRSKTACGALNYLLPRIVDDNA